MPEHMYSRYTILAGRTDSAGSMVDPSRCERTQKKQYLPQRDRNVVLRGRIDAQDDSEV